MTCQNKTMKQILLLSGLFLISSSQLQAQDDAAELAKKLSNPISSLISVPLQNNSDLGIGDLEGSRNTLNIQPVVPIGLNDNLNLIVRVILPVIWQYNITGVGETESGVSDAVVSGFFSPALAENGLTWGAGPVLLLPTGADILSTKKFGVGPTAVLLKQNNGWTYGALFNQIWSVAGDKDRKDVSQAFLQPFLIYNWKSGAGVGGNFEVTQNWDADQTIVWLNPTISGLTSLGKQKVSFALGPRFNLAAPDGAKANWGVRAVATFLFPK